MMFTDEYKKLPNTDKLKVKLSLLLSLPLYATLLIIGYSALMSLLDPLSVMSILVIFCFMFYFPYLVIYLIINSVYLLKFTRISKKLVIQINSLPLLATILFIFVPNIIWFFITVVFAIKV